MSSVDLPQVDKKAIEDGVFRWNQRIVNHALRVIEACSSKDVEIVDFFRECEAKVRDMECSRIVWNTDVHKFGGTEYAYVWYFYSDLLSSPIKISVHIDSFNSVIYLGNLDLPSPKEGRKLDKHLNTLKLNKHTEVQ